MPVHINPPMTVQAVPAREFDQWFYTDFRAENITPTSGSLSFAKIPMNSTNGDTYPQGAIGVQVDLWQAVANVPSAAAALQSVLTALPDIENWKNNQ